MTSRRSLEEKIQIVILYVKFENCEEVRRQWKNYFDSNAPDPKTIKHLYERFQQTGSVADLPRSGRPSTSATPERLEEVQFLIEQNPRTSVSAGAAALDIPRSSYHALLKKLDLHPYRPQRVPQLLDDDWDRRTEFCDTMLIRFHENPTLLDHILWSDESMFYLNGTVSRHNDVVWDSANPHNQLEVRNTQQSVMVWCGLTSDSLVGPHFFEGGVGAAQYLEMLNTTLWPFARYKRLTFQQDGAPAHYALDVRAWLDEKFPSRWIGRRGPTEWPARSPDLTPCDFFLWGYLKERVYRERPATIPELRDRIAQCCAEIPANLLAKVCQSVPDRFRQCVASQGAQLLD
jgi:hypothetical protein